MGSDRMLWEYETVIVRARGAEVEVEDWMSSYREARI